METVSGISIYFCDNRIHILKDTIRALGNPRYVHLHINEEKKYLFISACEKDKDAFRIYYKVNDATDEMNPKRFHINAKGLLNYLSKVIGVERYSDSLRFPGQLLEGDSIVYFDLTNYEVIPY